VYTSLKYLVDEVIWFWSTRSGCTKLS